MPRQTACHRHYVSVFMCLGFRFSTYKISGYSSSNSKNWQLLFGFWAGFFNPVIHIGFTETKHLANASSACTGVICFYCLLANFLGIFPCFRFMGVVFFAFLAKAPLCSRTVFSRVHLIFCSSADWTFPSCYFFCFSHVLIVPYCAFFVHTFKKPFVPFFNASDIAAYVFFAAFLFCTWKFRHNNV